MQGHRTLHSASVSLLQRLQQLQGVFQAADVNGTGDLDESDFLSAFKGMKGCCHALHGLVGCCSFSVPHIAEQSLWLVYACQVHCLLGG